MIPPPAPPALIIPPPPPPSSGVILQEPPKLRGDNNQTLELVDFGNWQLRIDATVNGGCYVVTTYTDQSYLRVGYNPLTEDLTWGLGSNFWRSLAGGEEISVSIKFPAKESWEGAGVVDRQGGFATIYVPIGNAKFIEEMTNGYIMQTIAKGVDLGWREVAGFDRAFEGLLDCQDFVNQELDPFAPDD